MEHTKNLKNIFLNFENKMYLKNQEEKKSFYKNLNFSVNLVGIDLMRKLAIKAIGSTYKSLYNKRQLLETHTTFSSLYQNINYYFDVFIDYRGRNYPTQYLFARTIGYLKYYSQDSDSVKLTLEGFKHFLTSYYKSSLIHLELFEHFLENEKTDYDDLYNFFINNQVSHIVKNKTDFLYFYLLEIEIFSLKKNDYKTAFLIEKDMKSSGPTFLSILFRNNDLGNKTNLTEKKPNDFVKFLMINTKKFFVTELLTLVNDKNQKSKNQKAIVTELQFNIETRRILLSFENNKSLHKNAAMYFFYGQQYRNRTKE